MKYARIILGILFAVLGLMAWEGYISILIIFVYYVIRAFSLNLGETGTIHPLLAAWLPVIIISIIALTYFINLLLFGNLWT